MLNTINSIDCQCETKNKNPLKKSVEITMSFHSVEIDLSTLNEIVVNE